jgi:6-phospho-beta-glucosidase
MNTANTDKNRLLFDEEKMVGRPLMPERKIVILGGGSPFVPSLVYTMLENKEIFERSEVCLMDIDPSRLPLLARVGEQLANKAKVRMRFTHTTNPKKALDGATFVMPSYRIGGEKHMQYDFTIPTKYGIAGDETAGPGGTFMAQCTIPATLEYCRLSEELCPDAWFVSFINPANFISDAVHKQTKTKFISICDCFAGFAMSFLPYILGMPPMERRYCVNSDLRPRGIGVNHVTWLVDLLVNGQDGYPLLKKKIQQKKTELIKDHDMDFSLRLLETYGYLNLCPDHCQMLWEHDEVLKQRKTLLKSRKKRATILGWTRSAWKYVNKMAEGANYNSRRPEYCFHLHHARQAIGIIVSIIADEGREWGGINYPNNGAITNLPQEAIVEGPCKVDKRGLTPIAMGELPKPFLGVTLHTLNWQQLTVDAALNGDKNLLYQAILASPYVHDMQAARKIADELLSAHKPYLPQFKQ